MNLFYHLQTLVKFLFFGKEVLWDTTSCSGKGCSHLVSHVSLVPYLLSCRMKFGADVHIHFFLPFC